LKRALILVLLCAGCFALAQPPCTAPKQIQPLQVKVCDRSGQFSLPCQFDNPVTAGDFIDDIGIGVCNPLLPPDSPRCDSTLDSQGNSWHTAIVVPQYNGMSLAFATAQVGADTVYFAPNTHWVDIIEEWPPSTGLDDAAWGSYTDAGLTPTGIEIQDNSGWAGVHRPGQAAISPLETHESCELLISWTLVGGPAAGTVSAGPGFTLRANNLNWLAVEDSTSTGPGYYLASMRWQYATAWNEGVAAFRTGGCK